jgi:uncharacterized protein (TIGR02597 family)
MPPIAHTARTVVVKLAGATALFAASTSFSQISGPEPVGFLTLRLPGKSDTVVSAPVARPAEFIGTGKIATLVASKSARITFSDSPFASSAFKSGYYAFLASGAREGAYYTIIGNDSSSLTIDLNGDSLSTASATVKVIPYWTLATLLRGGAGLGHRSRVLVPDVNGNGFTLAGATAYRYSAGHWRRLDGRIADSTTLPPDNYFVVRNKNATIALPISGAAVTSKIETPLATARGKRQDNYVALARPIGVSLSASGLIASKAFNPRTDKLLVFDNSVARYNKKPASIYTYRGGTWRKGSSTADAGDDVVFEPGSGVIIEKRPSKNGAKALWKNSPTYAF